MNMTYSMMLFEQNHFLLDKDILHLYRSDIKVEVKVNGFVHDNYQTRYLLDDSLYHQTLS